MKINNFLFEVRPMRGAWGLDHPKELRFRIVDAGGLVRESRTVITPDFIPDQQSLLDYIFDRAKEELKNNIVQDKK